MYGEVLPSLVSLGVTALIVFFVVGLFGGGSAAAAQQGRDPEVDTSDLPRPGIWGHREAWGRWEDPLKRERYFRACRDQRNDF
jgi:hypothetical protein